MMTPKERDIVRSSQEYWAVRMPTMVLEDALQRAKLFLQTYPGNEPTEMQIDVLEVELAARQAKYIAWLEANFADQP